MLVIPRDLFNHAKILKCMGRLSLYIYDRVDNIDEAICLNHHGNNFNVYQNPDSGNLVVTNLDLYTKRGREIELFTHYNSKENYPLWFGFSCDCDFFEGEVFDDQGILTEDFNKLINHIKEFRL